MSRNSVLVTGGSERVETLKLIRLAIRYITVIMTEHDNDVELLELTIAKIITSS